MLNSGSTFPSCTRDTDALQVRNYFEDKVQTIANKYNASAMFWEEVFDKVSTLVDGRKHHLR